MKKQEKSSSSNGHPTYPSARLNGMDGFMAFAKVPEWRPPMVDKDLFRTLDLANGKEREAVAALRFLGIIDQDGAPSPVFDELKIDYQGVMRRQVQAGYAGVFSLLPTKMVNQARLVNFFKATAAKDSAEYMAKMFVWSCQQSGIDLPNCEKKFHRAHNDKDEPDGVAEPE